MLPLLIIWHPLFLRRNHLISLLGAYNLNSRILKGICGPLVCDMFCMETVVELGLVSLRHTFCEGERVVSYFQRRQVSMTIIPMPVEYYPETFG